MFIYQVWPSLDSSKIRKLEVLLNDTPTPTRIHLQVWSRTLQAEQMHVENWVQLHQTQAIQVGRVILVLQNNVPTYTARCNLLKHTN